MKKQWIALLLAAGCGCAFAQVSPPPQNVLQLSAAGTVEVTQDLLSMHLSTTREGTDPAVVQNQLKAALEAALAEAKRSAQPGQMEVRTGNFALYLRNNPRDGKINGWQGTVELVLEGRDFPRITQAAGRITTLTLAGVSFALSREQRAKVEGEAQHLAIEQFKSRAEQLAREFGFAGYTLREVTVNSSDAGFARPMMAKAMAQGEGSPVPVEAGKSAVTVNVSGSVQMR